MGFSQTLLDGAKPLRDRILAHPFVQGLGDGTLPVEKFRFYLEQDYLFLIEYCRVLSLAVAKSREPGTMRRFAELLHSTLEVEMELHRGYSAQFGLSARQMETAAPAATTHAYTRHLLAIAWGGGLGEIAAGLLPCQWGYLEVATRLAEAGGSTPTNPYHRWIESYTANEYADLAHWIRGLVDAVAEQAGPVGRMAMETAFVESSRYELMFWDMAWKGGADGVWLPSSRTAGI